MYSLISGSLMGLMNIVNVVEFSYGMEYVSAKAGN